VNGALACPVTGERVPITEWRISDRLSMVQKSGSHLKPDPRLHAPLVSCTSPVGGTVFLDAIALGLLERAVVQ
jgi:hypothetical protein